MLLKLGVGEAVRESCHSHVPGRPRPQGVRAVEPEALRLSGYFGVGVEAQTPFVSGFTHMPSKSSRQVLGLLNLKSEGVA